MNIELIKTLPLNKQYELLEKIKDIDLKKEIVEEIFNKSEIEIESTHKPQQPVILDTIKIDYFNFLENYGNLLKDNKSVIELNKNSYKAFFKDNQYSELYLKFAKLFDEDTIKSLNKEVEHNVISEYLNQTKFNIEVVFQDNKHKVIGYTGSNLTKALTFAKKFELDEKIDNIIFTHLKNAEDHFECDLDQHSPQIRQSTLDFKTLEKLVSKEKISKVYNKLFEESSKSGTLPAFSPETLNYVDPNNYKELLLKTLTKAFNTNYRYKITHIHDWDIGWGNKQASYGVRRKDKNDNESMPFAFKLYKDLDLKKIPEIQEAFFKLFKKKITDEGLLPFYEVNHYSIGEKERYSYKPRFKRVNFIDLDELFSKEKSDKIIELYVNEALNKKKFLTAYDLKGKNPNNICDSVIKKLEENSERVECIYKSDFSTHLPYKDNGLFMSLQNSDLLSQEKKENLKNKIFKAYLEEYKKTKNDSYLLRFTKRYYPEGLDSLSKLCIKSYVESNSDEEQIFPREYAYLSSNVNPEDIEKFETKLLDLDLKNNNLKSEDLSRIEKIYGYENGKKYILEILKKDLSLLKNLSNEVNKGYLKGTEIEELIIGIIKTNYEAEKDFGNYNVSFKDDSYEIEMKNSTEISNNESIEPNELFNLIDIYNSNKNLQSYKNFDLFKYLFDDRETEKEIAKDLIEKELKSNSSAIYTAFFLDSAKEYNLEDYVSILEELGYMTSKQMESDEFKKANKQKKDENYISSFEKKLPELKVSEIKSEYNQRSDLRDKLDTIIINYSKHLSKQSISSVQRAYELKNNFEKISSVIGNLPELYDFENLEEITEDNIVTDFRTNESGEFRDGQKYIVAEFIDKDEKHKIAFLSYEKEPFHSDIKNNFENERGVIIENVFGGGRISVKNNTIKFYDRSGSYGSINKELLNAVFNQSELKNKYVFEISNLK